MRRAGSNRRVACAAAAIALGAVTAATVSPGSGPGPIGPGEALAADCVPVTHTKTVVKRVKVKRHGKVRRVKRKRKVSWVTCEPAPAPPAARCDQPASNLGVTARDATGSSFTLSRSCVDAGLVSVQLNNQGEDPHNVFLRPVSGPDPGYSIPDSEPYELGPLSQDEGEFELSVGDWYLWCSLLTHEEQGMNAHLTVR